jgi:hypothetical protein
MNRREMDRLLLMGTALAAGWPAWLRRAFGAEPARNCPAPGADEGAERWRRIVGAAYRRARQAGKPLLAFVVPVVDDESGEGYGDLSNRGSAFGELLNHGSDEALATLALAEIVCAPMTALRALAPSVPGKQPLMVLIETDAVPARVQVLDGRLPKLPLGFGEPDEAAPARDAPPRDWEAYFSRRRQDARTRDHQAVQARLALLSRLLDQGLRATPQMLLERAAQAQARLGALAVVPDDAAPAQLHRVAAILLASAVALPAPERSAAVRRVADAARAVLCRQRVPGSRWANDSGCASQVEYEPGEEHDELMMACGMGHVPEESRRFLDFLSRDAKWRS